MYMILPHLLNLSKVTVKPHYSTARLETLFGINQKHPVSILSAGTWSFVRSIQQSVKIEVVFVLTQPLSMTWVGAHGFLADIDPGQQQDHHSASMTTFKGTLSDGPYTWCGLELDLASWDVRVGL